MKTTTVPKQKESHRAHVFFRQCCSTTNSERSLGWAGTPPLNFCFPFPRMKSTASLSKQSVFDQYCDIQRIPLLLAYPTSLLASNFIFDKQANPNLPHHHVLALAVIVIPLFLASVSTGLHTLMTPSHVVRKKRASVWQTNRLLLALFGLFASAWILGSVRTVVLTLVLMMNVHIPFVLVSFALDAFSLYHKQELHLWPQDLSQANIYLILAAYIVIFQIKDTLRNFDRLDVKNNPWVALATGVISGAVLLLEHQKLLLPMILVTIGCVAVLNIGKFDLQNKELRRGSATVMSIVSILLEVLSLNSNYTEHYGLTALEFLLILSTLLIPVDEDLLDPQVDGKESTEGSLSILHQLYRHKDTRAIFSFLLLNTSFMFVQFLYSFRSKSLGLLSDSLHMALDCTSLALGLVAGVLAKKPPSESFPFGLSKIETLAGFANGVLLIGIVAGIVVEAIERLINPVNLEKTGELLIVSFLGLVVNIVGIFAFNHGHEHGGHSHGHSHSHSHDHSEGSNENMHGIFLHILADTLGSAGVVVSTLLTKFFHSDVFDPLASLFIAFMIFFSAVPLIKSCASNLLLSLDDKKDELIRDILSQIVSTPGIVGYSTPRFWNSPCIVTSSSISHGHSHSVEVDHSAKHNHEHSHDEHTHTHSKDLDCESLHDHDHNHNHDHDHTDSDKEKYSMVGFIHIQYLEGENSTIIKKRVQKIFENNNIKAIIQVENENSSCWCRLPAT